MGVLRVPGRGVASASAAADAASDEPVVFQSDSVALTWDGKAIGEVSLSAKRTPSSGAVSVHVSHSLSDSQSVTLHWGLLTEKSKGAWSCPDLADTADTAAVAAPPSSVQMDQSAAQTPFGEPIDFFFPMDPASGVLALVFVVKRVSDAGVEMWLNAAGAGDFKVALAAASNDDVAERIKQAEQGNGNCMFNRFCMVMDLMGAAQDDEDAAAWIYTLLRYHHTKQLDWYGSHNYQSKDIGHIKGATSLRVAQVCANPAASLEVKRLARMSLAFLSRGGGQAEDIRIEILNIMRRHGIKEGHRPGIDDKFIEQWHQKLHQNTSADDIAICESYLHFLHTGNEGDFWSALWDRGISREYLANMKNPITATPFHLPQLINDIKGYLWILKTVHAGADLSFMIEGAKWVLEKVGDNEAVGWLYEIKFNFNEWWIPGKIAETRNRLAHAIMNTGDHGARDGLLLDAALEGAFKTAIERSNLDEMDGDALLTIVELVLGQAVVSRGFAGEFQGALDAWRKHVVGSNDRWSRHWALRAKAMADNLGLILAAEAEKYIDLLQPKAEQLAAVAGIPASHVMNFSEEVVRGQPSFLLSLYLQKLDSILRKSAGLSDWQLISPGAGSPTIGKLRICQNIADLMTEKLEPRTILFAEYVGGNDDIPENVVGLLTPSSLDVLSHVAIRARNQKVFCASCSKEAYNSVTQANTDSVWVSLATDPSGDIKVSQAEAQEETMNVTSGQAKSIKLRQTEPSKSFVINQELFAMACVGGKSINIAELGKKLNDGEIQTPCSMASPFGSFEKCLASNNDLEKKVRTLEGKASEALASKKPANMTNSLAELRELIIANLGPGQSQLDELDTAVKELNSSDEVDASGLWLAIKHVWASKWTDRAFLSRASLGIAHEELNMAVLLQQVFPARLAFVLHTANPLDQDLDTVLGEVVFGMGETLVGNYPGRALCFTAKKGTQGHEVVSYPSKRLQVSPPSNVALMVRSDSNGEDLEDFAGAGLYDSIVCGPDTPEESIGYASEKCDDLFDDAKRSALVTRLVDVAVLVENAFDNKPQDIEGVVLQDGSIAIVQSRPQIL